MKSHRSNPHFRLNTKSTRGLMLKWHVSDDCYAVYIAANDADHARRIFNGWRGKNADDSATVTPSGFARRGRSGVMTHV